MSWNRVSEWEGEERPGYVLLTPRGGGATTPLLIPGWTLDDLEILMRDMTADSSGPEPAASPVEDVAPTPAPDPSGAERHRHRMGGKPWKAVVTLVLLGVLATAVILVLLQSAGIISWGFLGPTA
ncbi:MAG: hypothetical protein ABSE98_05495 [Acidimicrobiales bacterium]|jgi:hypothetical protein